LKNQINLYNKLKALGQMLRIYLWWN